MKKILLSLTVLLLLVGCTSATIKPVSNESLFTINGKTITEADVFQSMHISATSIDLVKSEAEKALINVLVKDDARLNTKIEELIKTVKDALGDNFELFLSENGFANEQAYIDAIVKDTAKLDILLENVMADDYAALTKYRPRQVRIVETTKEDSDAALALAKTGVSLEAVHAEYGREGAVNDGSVVVVSELSTLNTAPLDILLNATENGLIDETVANSSSAVYYILEVVELDVEAVKDAAVAIFAQDSKLSESYLSKLFIEHKFKLYDQSLLDSFKTNYPDYIK